jgi:hypothetical protein
MRTGLSPVSAVPCSLDSHLSMQLCLYAGGEFFRMGQLTKSPITAGIAVHSGQVAHGRKKGVGYGSFSVHLVTSCLSKPVVHLAPPCVKKLRPGYGRMAQDLFGQQLLPPSSPSAFPRDSTGHENRAFLAAGVGCRHA